MSIMTIWFMYLTLKRISLGSREEIQISKIESGMLLKRWTSVLTGLSKKAKQDRYSLQGTFRFKLRSVGEYLPHEPAVLYERLPLIVEL